MSDKGHERLSRSLELSSAFPLKADRSGSPRRGRFVPIAAVSQASLDHLVGAQ
jgi:hypothetical protein